MLCEALMPASLIRSVDRTLHSIGDCASKSYRQHMILCEDLDACLSDTFRRSNSSLYRRLCASKSYSSTSYSGGGGGTLMPVSLIRSVDRTLHSIGDSVRINPTDSTSYSGGTLMPVSLIRSVDGTLHSIKVATV